MAINGFSTCNSATIGTYRVPGTSVSLAVRREIAPLLLGFAREFHDKVEPLRAGWCWGYHCRRVTGGSFLSWHAAGIAVDLNAPRHPYGRAHTFNARQRATIRVLAQKYGLRWGGDYTRTKDDMHLEVIVSRSQALDMVRRLQTPARTSPTVAVPRLSKLVYGATNADIVLLQRRLTARRHDPGPADGTYGPRTRAAVRAFQHSLGWSGSDADGHVGPVTLDELF